MEWQSSLLHKRYAFILPTPADLSDETESAGFFIV